jgi:hypothetical protein
MSNRFLISVAAAALIAGTGFANAQGSGGGAGSAPAAQQSAPSGGASSGGAMHRDSGGSAGSAMQREPGGSSGMKGAESGMKGSEPGMKSTESDKAPPSSKSAQDGNRMQGEKSKSMHSETDTPKDSKGGKDMKAEGREGKEKTTVGQAPDKSGAAMKGHDEKMGREDKMGRDDKMNAQGQKGTTEPSRAQTNQGTQTTGNAATSARVAAPPPEKRTQIVSAIRSEKIQETNVNVNVSIGTVLPASVHFYPLPPRIVEIYPEWRGFEVVLIHGRYVIVRPHTREIVYIIES